MEMKHKHYAPETPETKKKKLISIICSIVALCLVFVIVLTCGCSGCTPTKETVDTSTADEMSMELNIDEDAYIFSDGIYLGTVSLAGHSYASARKLATEECESMVNEFTLTVKANSESFDYTRDSFTWDNNVEEALKEAYAYNESKIGNSDTSTSITADKVIELKVEVNNDSVKKAVAEIAEKVDIEPKNATISNVSNKKVSFSDAQVGYCVDQEALVKAMVKEIAEFIAGTKTSAVVTATIKETLPKLNFDDLNGKIQFLATHSTVSTNGANGNHNMKKAMDMCNASVIEPGETWSFNKTIGDSTTPANGWKSAGVIVNGKFSNDYGGGICQASTTIYQAALKANLTVVERYNHRYKSSYAPIGLDATIDYPALDLKLKNDTDYPIYFETYMTGTKLVCNVYGWQDPSFDEIKLTSGSSGNSAWATRTFYKNGKVVDKEALPSSRYGSSYNAPTSSSDSSDSTTAATKPAATKPEATKPSSGGNTPTTTPSGGGSSGGNTGDNTGGNTDSGNTGGDVSGGGSDSGSSGGDVSGGGSTGGDVVVPDAGDAVTE